MSDDLRCKEQSCGCWMACALARDTLAAEDMPMPTGMVKDDGLSYFVGKHYSECQNFRVRKALASDGSTPKVKRYKPMTAEERYSLGPNLMVKKHIRRSDYK